MAKKFSVIGILEVLLRDNAYSLLVEGTEDNPAIKLKNKGFSSIIEVYPYDNDGEIASLKIKHPATGKVFVLDEDGNLTVPNYLKALVESHLGTLETIEDAAQPIGSAIEDSEGVYVRNESTPITHGLKVYPYKLINGIKIFSASAVAQEIDDEGITDTENYRVDWSWDAVTGADGYRLLKSNSDLSWDYDHYVDVGTNSYSDVDPDDWTVGDTVTPTTGIIGLAVRSSGNVGIGNFNPVYMLDVAGDINTTGTLRINTVAIEDVIDGRIAKTPASISASDIDWSLSLSFYKTLGANTTFTFSNLVEGKTISVAIKNPAAATWTVTWPGTVKWPGGTPPVQTTNDKTDVYTFTRINGVIYGSAVQNF
jgi:hypothetical protein